MKVVFSLPDGTMQEAPAEAFALIVANEDRTTIRVHFPPEWDAPYLLALLVNEWCRSQRDRREAAQGYVLKALLDEFSNPTTAIVSSLNSKPV